MFTGLVETVAQVVDNVALPSGRRIKLNAPLDGILPGESIAINGVCLTALPDVDTLTFDVSPETLGLTTLGEIKAGDQVNMERALSVGARMGGHYVSGHVDTTAEILSVRADGAFVEMSVGNFLHYAKPYLLPKGSITLNGVSLTINRVTEDTVTLMLVPHTLNMTTFGFAVSGQRVNVEFDYLTRIIAHQLALMPGVTTI